MGMNAEFSFLTLRFTLFADFWKVLHRPVSHKRRSLAIGSSTKSNVFKKVC